MATWARLPVGSPPAGRSMRGQSGSPHLTHSLGSGTQLLERGAGPSTTLELPRVSGRAGVGLLIAPQLSRHVLEFTPVNERVASLRLLLGSGIGLLLLFVPTGRTAVQSTRPSWSPWEGCPSVHVAPPGHPLGRRSMIDFVVVSSDLRPYVLDTFGFRGRLGTLSPSGPCSLPPLSTRQFEVVDARSLVPVVAATPNPVVDTGSQASLLPGRSWRQKKLGSGRRFGEAMEEDYRSASKRFWQTIRRLRRGKQYSANTVYSAGGELLTSTGDIVGRWKKYFEDLLNPTDLPSNEEAEAGVSEVDSSITQAEVTEVVRKLLEWQGAGGG
ncbi:hypothetical protein L3Q82_022104 [Scortum barcoo]|uniref:Uncharacterized protein n=1 Tax=Scortum barcoo TaxID=214431 RepID=A0ACB8X3I1_9TELE|nr:hypothetical protein L3Q82_022104 [Scortum barcoo]